MTEPSFCLCAFCLAEFGWVSFDTFPRWTGGYWLALLQVLVWRLLPPLDPLMLAEFFLSLFKDSAFLGALDEAVVAVWFVSSSRRFVTPKVPWVGFFGAVSIDAAFFNFSCSALPWPAEPFNLILGPGVFANAFATFVLVGAKWLAPTTFTFPVSYFCRLFKISVLTLATVR